MQEDNRTLAELAKEAFAVQDACNLLGVVNGYARALRRLRRLYSSASSPSIEEHPISKLWADKVAHLSGTQGCSPDWTNTYRQVERMASATDKD